MNIVRFLQSVSGKIAAALAMMARVWKQNRIAVLEQQMSVSCHAFTIVSNSMQQDSRITVVIARMNKPALQFCSISHRNRHVLQFRAEISSHRCGNGLLMAQRKAVEFKANIGYDDAGQNG